MRILNSRQMREADRRAIQDLSVPSLVLMEAAGRETAAAIAAAYPDVGAMRVAVLSGRGNNGGDGFVVARHLQERGARVAVYVAGRHDQIAGDARTNLDALRHLDVEVVDVPDADAWARHRAGALAADLLVDALFGTGLTPPLTGLAEAIVIDVNAAGRPVVAIDLPSGLSADTPAVTGPAVRAALTVTMAASKLPLALPPGDALAGRVVVADIGIPQRVIADLDGPWIEVLTPESLRPLVKPRAADSHKGTYGRVLILAGSRGKTGAAALAAMAALRSGAGLVTVGTPASCLPIVAGLGTEFMTEPLEETAEGTIASEALERVLDMPADVIAVGPGLGRSSSTTAFVHGLLERCRVPIVLDADGLNAFAGHADRLTGRAARDVIVTPHPGEMARLVGVGIADVQADRLRFAREFALTRRLHVVLKGHRTLVATPDDKTFINRTGNPGMATGGTGDVLTGMVAAWFGQLREASQAAALAVYLHGLAGDLAAGVSGEVALIARDVIDHLGAAVQELTGRAASARVL